MPYFKCRSCHHEWEGSKKDTICDWCRTGNAAILENETPLEKMGRNLFTNKVNKAKEARWLKMDLRKVHMKL